MAVVDLEEVLLQHGSEVFRGECPAEVGVVYMSQHGAAGSAALFVDGLQTLAHHVLDAGPIRRQDGFLDVERVYVDGDPFLELHRVVGAQFFRLDQKEFFRALKLRSVFLQLLESNLFSAVFLTGLDPRGAKAGQIFIQGRGGTRGRLARFHQLLGDPDFLGLEDVVIRDGEELVPVLLVPVGDHLWKVIAIAPEAVGVSVALVPLFRRSG